MEKYFISDDEMTNKIIAKFGNDGGAYILCCDNGSGKPIPVNRMLATDDSGVLYIGQAKKYSNRVAELKRSIAPGYSSSPHECGSRYKKHEAIASTFPYEQLCICLISSKSPRETEAELMKNYQNKFGELPPLNRNS